jgi:hypothetical protein
MVIALLHNMEEFTKDEIQNLINIVARTNVQGIVAARIVIALSDKLTKLLQKKEVEKFK